MKFRVGLSMLLGLGTALSAWFVPSGGGPWIRPRRAAVLPQDPVPVAALDATKLSKLTGLSLGSGRRGIAPARPTEPTKLPLRARGTLLGAPEDWAAIENLETGKMNSYAVGDLVLGAKVVAIERSLVTLSEGCDVAACEPVKLTYLEVSGIGRLLAPPPPPGAPQFTLSRREVEQRLTNFEQLATEVRVVPSTQGGFKIYAVRPGSFPDKLGIRNGDRVMKLNGIDLSVPDKILGAYPQLVKASHFEIELVRGDATVVQSYNLE